MYFREVPAVSSDPTGLVTRLEDLGFSGQPTHNRNQHTFRVSAGLVFQFGGRVE